MEKPSKSKKGERKERKILIRCLVFLFGFPSFLLFLSCISLTEKAQKFFLDKRVLTFLMLIFEKVNLSVVYKLNQR